ncbi:imidazole glycerol phosphate synthase subunit HisH [bacterium SCSIO 12741]|nr:imidazole glycerol phosphate synthase subunit HisH [bacterium SCSIO 12741]
MIGIINYGMGNLASVLNGLKALELDAEIVDNPNDLDRYERLILPGVGAFKQAMDNLRESGFKTALDAIVEKGDKPLLGICLGMQLLFEKSFEHGENTGLGYIPGEVLPFGDQVKNHRIPHVGWNTVYPQSGSRLLPEQAEDFYFVHSFYCHPTGDEEQKGMTEYEIKFCSVVEHGQVFGAQFHPEKSQKHGLQLLKKFAELPC